MNLNEDKKHKSHSPHLLSPALATYSFPIKLIAAKAQQPPEMAYEVFSFSIKSSWEKKERKWACKHKDKQPQLIAYEWKKQKKCSKNEQRQRSLEENIT